MAGKIGQEMDPQMAQAPSDPWAAAFAALDQEDEKTAETTADAVDGGSGEDVRGSQGSDVPDAKMAHGSEGALEAEGADGPGAEDAAGGPGDIGGADGGQDAGAEEDGSYISEEEVKRYRQEFEEDVRNRAISDVAKAYIDRGARHTNGRLGASINDADICKRDRDGVPRFYNPETGREFTGDNPRRQAQEWVDDYNKALAEAFNKTCKEYEDQLRQEEGGRIAILEFAPTYHKLDPVRKGMLDSLLEDYEVLDDNGEIVSYSCDLNKALAAVNRLVRRIQGFGGTPATTPTPAAKAEPSGPALDTPSTTGGKEAGGRPEFKSVAEAMEWLQDQELNKERK